MARIIAPAAFGRAKIVGDDIPGLPDGSDNPLWPDLLQATTRGLYVEKRGNKAVLDGLTDFDELTIAKVVGMAAIGVEVEEYPAFAKIAAEDMEDEVPEALPGAKVLSPLGEETDEVKTWSEYRPTAPVVAGYAYVELATPDGFRTKGSVLAQLVAAGVTILSEPEAIEDIAANSPQL